jgi:hypothetical protein
MKAETTTTVSPIRRAASHCRPERARREGGRRWRTIGLLWCVTILVAGTATFLFESAAAPSKAEAATTPYLTASVTPGQDLVTGQRMTLTVSRTSAGTTAGVQITKVVPGWCAGGTDLPTVITSQGVSAGTNFPPTGEHTVCTTPIHPTLSSNALPQLSVISPTTRTAQSVTGKTFAQVSDGRKMTYGTLACDAGHPCTFAMAVYVQFKTPSTIRPVDLQGGAIYFLQIPVTFLPTTVNASCGGAAGTQLTSVGPDSLGQTITDWTVDGCEAKVGGGKALASVVSSGSSDDTALCDFANGEADFAYSGIGYGTKSSPFNPANCPVKDGSAQSERPYVAVPVALNAVVLAHTETLTTRTNVANGYNFNSYTKQLGITDVQAAQLLGADGHTLSWTGTSKGPTSLGRALVRENPTLVHDFYYTNLPTTNGHNPISHHNQGTNATGVVVTSGTNATTFIGTRFFQSVVPATTWVSPAKVGATKTHPALGANASFALATPPYDVDPATGLTTIVHVLTPTTSHGGMPWAFIPATDSDAIWFGMANLALQVPGTTPPVYVSPTTTTAMQAAVANMTAQPDGTLLPDPTGGAVSGKEPYPLTFVEYVFAPTEPLMGTGCKPRTVAEQHLIDWLDYITGVGQTELPKGLAPLPPSLQAQALTAIAQVGEAPPTCTPTKTTTKTGKTTKLAVATTGTTGTAGTTTSTTPLPAASHGSGGPTSSGSGSGSSSALAGTRSSFGSTGSSGSPSGTKTGSTSTPPSPSKARLGTTPDELAGFTAAEGTSWLLPAVGVLLLFLLLPGLVLLASGRSPRQVLASLRGQPGGGQPSEPDEPSGTGGSS